MDFKSKLTEAEYNEYRNMTRSKAYWVNLLYPILLFLSLGLRTRRIISSFLNRPNPNSTGAVIVVVLIASLIPWTIYWVRRSRAQQLSRYNQKPIDQISLTTDGIKFVGPTTSGSLMPWTFFRSWREGRHVILVEESKGNRFVILPVDQLSDIERVPIRQFLQLQIAQANH